jgi:hypothetical protein
MLQNVVGDRAETLETMFYVKCDDFQVFLTTPVRIEVWWRAEN